MPSRELPARPHIDHLRNEAKALHKAFDGRAPNALQRIRDVLGDRKTLKLTDAQRVIAREYGFPTWSLLRAHVQASRGTGEAIDAFLAAVQEQDRERARSVLRTRSHIATESLHVAAVLGRLDDAKRLIAEDPSRVTARAGNPAADPLLFLCYSPFHGESDERDAGLLATARLLLESGADPNTRDGQYGVPALYAVTGMRSVLPLARLLLDAGASPTDGESVFHAAERFHEDALEMLLSAGVDLNHTGEWGNTPLYFLLRWHNVAAEPQVRQGFLWLLNHDADPNVRCGKERENSLHVAARRGQLPEIIQLLLNYGADLNSRRGDGSSAWMLAKRGGFDEAAWVLERAGAEVETLSPRDALLAACGRGETDTARRLTSPELLSRLEPSDYLLLPEAAAAGRGAAVSACLAAGFPVDTADESGATALHHCAIHGAAGPVRRLLDAGADFRIRDREHSSTPLGWACFGADHVAHSGGDYAGCVQALLEAGAHVKEDEYQPRHEAVRAVIQQFKGR